MKGENWRGKAYSFISHNTCEYFPCHETENKKNFNCLFCYCPLYSLGNECGGNPTYTENGIKNCSNCKLPHVKENYGLIMKKLLTVVEKVREGGAK